MQSATNNKGIINKMKNKKKLIINHDYAKLPGSSRNRHPKESSIQIVCFPPLAGHSLSLLDRFRPSRAKLPAITRRDHQNNALPSVQFKK